MSEEQRAELSRILLESTPKEEGIEPTTSWDTRIFQLFIQERFGVFMCRTGVLRMLYRMFFCYHRLNYQLAKANVEKQQAFIQQVDRIKNCWMRIPYYYRRMRVISVPIRLYGPYGH